MIAAFFIETSSSAFPAPAMSASHPWEGTNYDLLLRALSNLEILGHIGPILHDCPMVPTLIFDLDGTLVDTAPDLLNAANAVLMARGRPAIPPATLHHMVGFGAKSLILQAFAATGGEPVPEDLPDLVDLFLDHYRAHLTELSRPFPGVKETLEMLSRQGAAMGILTNKPHDLAGPLLTHLNLAPYFAAIYGAGSRPYVKPDPRIFADVLAALGGGPAVMIGDSATDLKTARAAGVPCILVSYGYTPIPAATLGADLVLDQFARLPDGLKKLARVPKLDSDRAAP